MLTIYLLGIFSTFILGCIFFLFDKDKNDPLLYFIFLSLASIIWFISVPVLFYSWVKAIK